MSTSIDAKQQGMFCPECGQKNEAAAGYCEFCGAELVDNQPIVNDSLILRPANASSNFSIASVGKAIKNIPKKVKMITAAAVALAVVILALFAIGNAVTNPSGIAKGYFKAVSSGNYEEAFKYLALDTSDFVNKENFAEYMNEKGEEIGDVVNFSITELGKEKISKEEKELMKQWGISGDLMGSDDGFTKTYSVRYAVKGASAQNTQTITLVKNSKKKLLFFDDYNVNIDNLLVSGYTVSVPQGSSVSVDGIALTDLQPDYKSSNYDFDTANMDTYKIPKIFAGSHHLAVINNFCEDYEEKVSISRNSNGTIVSKMIMKESICKDLAKKTEDDYSSIFLGAIEGKSFDALGLSCTGDTEKADKIKSVYDDFVKKVKLNDDGVGYKSAALKSFADKGYQKEMSKGLTYTCSMEVNFDSVKVVNNSWFGLSLEEKTFTDQKQIIQFIFVYENSAWVLQSISLGSSY
ncbi:MAG: zinc ribbon domain-containing protein [Peptococcaceae bacterium]|nr:zinc ribbon domain-containing protein [Peptococcaceae bacterium]